MGKGLLKHGVLIPLGPPKHQHVVQPSIAPKATTAQTPLGGQCCHAAQDRAIGQSEAQIGGGSPHAATVARVPTYTYMHTDTYVGLCTLTNTHTQFCTGKPAPWATHMSIPCRPAPANP